MLKTYTVYYRFLLRYPWRFLIFGIALIIYSVALSIQPYFYQLFIDAIPKFDYRQILNILFLFIGVRLIRLLFDNLTQFFGDWLLFSSARDARMAVFNKIQDLDFAFHLSKSTGSLISAFRRGDGAFFDIHHSLNINISRFTIGFLVLLFFFRSINPLITFVMFATLILNLFLGYFVIKKNITNRHEFNKAEDHISEIIVDNLINFETVKLFAKEKQESTRLWDYFIIWKKKLWSYANSFRLIDFTVGTSGNLGTFIVLFIGLRQLITGSITPGQYVMVLGFVNEFYSRFFEIIWQFRNIAKNHADIQKYFSVLDNSVLVKDPIRPIVKTAIEGKIEFKNLSFSYPESKKLSLKNFNLIIHPGQSVAFVGCSGVGKTTIIKLLMRFYDPTKGSIFVDGTNIKKFTKSQLRSFMGVVPQEPILFNNTIGYNIAYGSDNAAKEEITGAAKLANLHDFIDNLPNKYETQVGERGIKLSGGQKQRLAIARMILSRPNIVIFDEATSQLDSESEKLIQDAFWKAVKNKTTLIIAHRLSTITRAEKIVVMEHGTIAEIGSHRQLLQNKNGLYTKFWHLQSRCKI